MPCFYPLRRGNYFYSFSWFLPYTPRYYWQRALYVSPPGMIFVSSSCNPDAVAQSRTVSKLLRLVPASICLSILVAPFELGDRISHVVISGARHFTGW